MLLAHRIRIDASTAQRDHFARAAGTARRVWNWGLAVWLRQTALGQKPNAMLLKKQFNRIKYSDPAWLDADGQPWLRNIHRDAHAQPFAHLARARSRYFEARRSGPSSRLCSRCGVKNSCLTLRERTWTCTCGARHDRDVNAAINLHRLAAGAFWAETALPEASQAVMSGTAAGTDPAAGGEVTPVRHEHGQQDGSGQEENGAHFCARFR